VGFELFEKFRAHEQDVTNFLKAYPLVERIHATFQISQTDVGQSLRSDSDYIATKNLKVVGTYRRVDGLYNIINGDSDRHNLDGYNG
jgi:hypothetical protein